MTLLITGHSILPFPLQLITYLTLFTVSKSTGRARMRIGWVLVKNVEEAKKNDQIHRAKQHWRVQVLAAPCHQSSTSGVLIVTKRVANRRMWNSSVTSATLSVMFERWRLLRQAVNHSGFFSLPVFSPGYCKFVL